MFGWEEMRSEWKFQQEWSELLERPFRGSRDFPSDTRCKQTFLDLECISATHEDRSPTSPFYNRSPLPKANSTVSLTEPERRTSECFLTLLPGRFNCGRENHPECGQPSALGWGPD